MRLGSITVSLTSQSGDIKPTKSSETCRLPYMPCLMLVQLAGLSAFLLVRAAWLRLNFGAVGALPLGENALP